MNYPIVQLVSVPESGATVRFDFNNAGAWSDTQTWPLHDGFTIGPPQLQGDPGNYGNQYGPRSLEFNLIVSGTFADAARISSRLALELGWRRNWLLFQLSPFSTPVWFHTYRTTPGALDFSRLLGTSDAQEACFGIGVSMAADPFACGERIVLDTYTIKNDMRASSGNALSVVLPEILGDAPAPLRLEMTAEETHDIPSPMISVTPVPDGFILPILPCGTGDVVTAIGDTEDPPSSISRSIPFGVTENLASRAYFALDGFRPGRYQAFLRVGRGVGSSASYTFQARVASRSANPLQTLERVNVDGPAYKQYVDLGTISLPTGLQDWDAAALGHTFLNLFVGRTSGSSALTVFGLVLVPVELFEDEPGLRLTVFPDELPASPSVLRVDGDGGYVQAYLGSGALTAIVNPAWMTGQFPQVVPGRANLLTLLRQTSTDARPDGLLGDQRDTLNNADSTSMQTTLTVSYQPRFLYLGASR